jgi:hypothetical protein
VGGHFKCYKTRDTSFPRFASRSVTLVDQFGSSSSSVVRPVRFCNPVDKNGEGISDPTAHLMCYQLAEGIPGPQRVVVNNQFGEQPLTVVKPETLCAPAEKDGVLLSSVAGAFLNHFKCYRVRSSGFEERTVSMVDQFEARTAPIVKPKLLCNPVGKNGEGIPRPDNHLVCYKIKPGPPPFTPRDVTVEDQFARQDLRVLRGNCRKADLLCLPSAKRLASPSGAFLDPL